jgi:hypothetical protein
MADEALRHLQHATRVALDASAHSPAELGCWQRAASEIDKALECCSSEISREGLIRARRHLRDAVTEMYRSERDRLTPEQNDAFALARAAATAALFELATRLAAAPPIIR